MDKRGSWPLDQAQNAQWPGVLNWIEWKAFNAPLLYKIYKDVVDVEWKDPTRVNVTPVDREPYDEDGLEHGVFNKHVFPSLNAALAEVSGHSDKAFDYMRGGRTVDDLRARPDWALCSKTLTTENGSCENCCPGDTKLWPRPSQPPARAS